MRRGQGNLLVRTEPGTWLAPWAEGGILSPTGLIEAAPWRTMRRMQEDVERVFEQLFGGGEAAVPTLTTEVARWTPTMDIIQTENEWCVEADLPGVNKDDIDIRVQNHQLILCAEMRRETPEQREETPGRRYIHRERRYGFFERVIPLPPEVDEEKIGCEFRNGVLSIHLPKTPQAVEQARRIPITAGETQTTQQGAAQQPSTQRHGVRETEQERQYAGAKGGERQGSQQHQGAQQK